MTAPVGKGRGDGDGGLALAAIGLEAEFSLVVNGEARRVEDVFDSPRSFIGRDLAHRVGSSYQLPAGGAVYFDTGVIEVATPPIEITRGCAVRACRSLWESILFVRQHLTDWERKTGNRAALVGFSAHYNVSFTPGPGAVRNGRTSDHLARLLAHILPVPVMALATNRSSTGVGVRPRENRIEVTADFTPDAALSVAAATLITGIIRDVMTWPSFDPRELAARRIPVIQGFEPMPHTSRRGWLARYDCFPANPFAVGLDERAWATLHVRSDQPQRPASLSLRQIGRRIFHAFRRPIARVADPFTLRFIADVFAGHQPSLLDLAARPAAYDDVGRMCTWDECLADAAPGRSRYERVLLRALSGTKLRIGHHVLRPVGMSGWSRVVFTRDDTRAPHTLPIDALLPHLDAWEKGWMD